jgi:hypothetical protein
MTKHLNVITCFALIISAYFVVSKVDEYVNRNDRQVMCQITQGTDKQVHIMPCRLIASYLAEVRI